MYVTYLIEGELGSYACHPPPPPPQGVKSFPCLLLKDLQVYTQVYVCMCAHVCVCVYVCTCVYTCCALCVNHSSFTILCPDIRSYHATLLCTMCCHTTNMCHSFHNLGQQCLKRGVHKLNLVTERCKPHVCIQYNSVLGEE